MKRNRQLISKGKNQRGVTAVVVAIVIAVLMGFVALAVDIGYVAATKNELQNVADSAALAGAGRLGQIYLNMNLTQQQAYDCSDNTLPSTDQCGAIIAQAQDVVGLGKNKAGGQDIVINSGDVIIGTWDNNTSIFSSTTSQPDAVRVIARRDAAANGPITTFFAKIFGISTADVRADAIAALTGPAVMNEGEMNLPIGLSKWQFFEDCDPGDPNEGICSEEITFSPTTDSCAGWHNFFDPINANAMRNKLLAFIAGDPLQDEPCLSEPCGENWLDQKFGMNNPPDGEATPVTTAGDSQYFFQGGTVATLFNGKYLEWEDGPNPEDKKTIPVDADGDGNQDVSGSGQIASFIALFDYFRFRDGDGDDSVWTAAAPVYDDTACCANPNQELTILGFADVTVRMPNPPPDSTVTATVYCDFHVIDGRGGGGTYGNLKGSIPNLVE